MKGSDHFRIVSQIPKKQEIHDNRIKYLYCFLFFPNPRGNNNKGTNQRTYTFAKLDTHHEKQSSKPIQTSLHGVCGSSITPVGLLVTLVPKLKLF